MPAPNTIFQGRYRIIRLLGKGGMGTVYEALDERLSRRIALKEMHVESDDLRRAFEREARLLANLQHPSLPGVMDHFSEEGGQFLIMEYIPGDDLAKILSQQNRPFTSDEVIRWANQLLDALEYLHDHVPPIVHRDIKPSNLKLTAKGQIVLLDFGLAKGAAGQMSLHENSLSVLGYSLNYAPLEQIQGEGTSPQSDLYSLAATLYHLLTNHKPTDALKRAMALISGEADPLEHISNLNPELLDNVSNILMQALSLQPARRPATAVVMRLALNNLQGIERPSTPNIAPILSVRPIPHESHPPDVPSETLTKYATIAYAHGGDYRLPSLDLLDSPESNAEQNDDDLYDRAKRLGEMFAALKVKGKVLHISPGPVLTTYEFRPEPGVKYSRVTGLADDICLAMMAPYVNIQIVPGTSNIGIQIPNQHRETVHLKQVIESSVFSESDSKLPIAFGVTVGGMNYVADLAKLPHLLIAGATGSGKSMFINSLIVSILYKARPNEVKFILVDPKQVEMGLYNDIPHLKTPIITDPKRAAHALKWAVSEMENRYKELAGWGVRNIDGYNAEVLRRNLVKDYDELTNEPWKPLPYIVIIIDELADLMMTCPDEIEESLTALARKERGVGIHLVLATQRPSSDVITGPIKANFPARISFHVASKADSRIIIDTVGAEELLSLGDMLFMQPKEEMVRIHGAFIDESEIGRIVSHIKAQGEPVYDMTITQSEDEAMGLGGASGARDELFEEALRICVEMKRASTSVLQMRLRIGYGRAAEILDMMEREGFIGQADGARPRPILSRAYETVAGWEE
jgi:DNA segregation ATPase FtsK/SpoIIIE-like protein/tRNA A-37 threonylcarbamoyl transferase component Bud32